MKVGAPYEDGGAVYIFLGAAEGIAGAPRVGRQWLKAEHLASQVVFDFDKTCECLKLVETRWSDVHR